MIIRTWMIEISEVRSFLNWEGEKPISSILSAWMPGQGVKVDYAAIIEILIQQLDNERT